MDVASVTLSFLLILKIGVDCIPICFIDLQRTPDHIAYWERAYGIWSVFVSVQRLAAGVHSNPIFFVEPKLPICGTLKMNSTEYFTIHK